ncbi:protein xpaC [Bacillus sp. M6-12]|uniref:5-bromo-4-chloroindolyl phosphate hydrolysis family protein n=1 Tax=Bacillus sp. M6-12 TaxID=2054166 RepID=UPI000C77C394|nr:5-bromo-4-chloroindolyl phosphate hydrolysis family protein [Bacillus sp. M6-12]PLS14755.1 protein xpaC [Bacillus sp. M6-12]
MNPFLVFVIRMFFAIPTAAVVWLVSMFALDQTFLLSTAFSLGAGAIIYGAVTVYLNSRFLKKHGLTRKEYQYIKGNLDEARQKISRLQKALFSIRQISSLKKGIELLRIARRIHNLAKKEPKRFYKAEKFFFSHLDSAVELTEKYVFLSAQPKKTYELEQSLKETRFTLEELTHTVEKDLYQVLSDDIDHLNFEIDLAKHSLKTIEESQLIDESRKYK